MLSERSRYLFPHIIEVTDPSNDIITTSRLTVDFQIQGLELFCVTFHISELYCYRKDLGVYVHIIEVKEHTNDVRNEYCDINGRLLIPMSQAIIIITTN